MPAPISTDYPTRFRARIIHGLEISLQDVCAAGTHLAEEIKEQALHLLDFALSMTEAWPYVRKLLLQLSPYLERHGDRRRWIDLLAHGLRLAEPANDQATAAQFHWSLGLLSRQISDFAAAEAHLQQSHQIAADQGLAQLAAKALTELAHLMQLQHRSLEAKEFVAAAHQLLPSDDANCAAGYSVLGDIYYSEQAWTQAINAFEHAIDLWKAADQLANAAGGWRGLARVRWATDDWEAAASCYECALALCIDADNPLQSALTAIGFGALYLEQTEPMRALPHFVAAEAILRPIEDRFHLAMLDLNYGIAHRLAKDWELAQQSLERSLAYYESIADHRRQFNALIELATLHFAMSAIEPARDLLAQAQSVLAQLPLSSERATLQQAVDDLWQKLYSCQNKTPSF